MTQTEDWQMCSTGERRHNTERTFTTQGSRPQFGRAVMILCSVASILHHQGNENEETDTQAETAESRDFEGQHTQAEVWGLN